MKKVKSVDPTGKITVTQTEERYPYSSEILMRHGFFIIFLNMALGLLPVTIWGTRVKYFKLSISQLYTTLFCLCFIALSFVFVPIVFFPKMDEVNSMTNMVILVAMAMLHTLGYICLLVRGHFVARKIPIVWEQLSKLLQIAILDVYGTNCYLLKEVRLFTRWSLLEYLVMMITTMGSMLVFSYDYSDGIDDSVKHYKLDVYIWPKMIFQNAFHVFQWFCFNTGYFIWQLCSSSHVLVAMFLCYMVIVIRICLMSVNQQIQEFKEKISQRKQGSSSGSVLVPRVQFSQSGQGLFGGGGHPQFISPFEYTAIVERLDTIKNVVLITEEITQTISLVWGISLIVEALIAIAAGTVNTFNFFAMFRQDENQTEENNTGIMEFTMPDVDNWIGVFIMLSTHFYFLFKLTSNVNKMIEESHKSLHLLKQISCHHLPKVISDKVQALKQDLTSTSISINAANFFQVNKFLLTSISSQITTYVIVLLQFAQQELNSNKNPGGGDCDAATTASN